MLGQIWIQLGAHLSENNEEISEETSLHNQVTDSQSWNELAPRKSSFLEPDNEEREEHDSIMLPRRHCIREDPIPLCERPLVL